MTDPTLAAIDAAKEDYTRGTSKGRHGLHSGSYKYATVDTILAALDLARAALQRPEVDLQELLGDIRAWRYPEGHSGVSDKEYMTVHARDEALVKYLIKRGLIGNAQGK